MVPVLTWMLIGVVAGALVRFAMKSRRDYGILGDLVLGSLGGVVGGWLFDSIGVTAPDNGLAHAFVAVIGAASLVGGLRVLRRAVIATVTTLPAAVAIETDLETHVRRLTDLERRVLARVLGNRPGTEDPNRVFDAQMTFGQRVADRVARFGGSWTFIGLFALGIAVWMIANQGAAEPFDPYPFILLNLILSCLAAVQAPVIMMSQNRQTEKDRLDARSDYEVNLRSEVEIMGLHAKLDTAFERDWREFTRIQEEQLALLRRIEARMHDAAPGDGPDREG